MTLDTGHLPACRDGVRAQDARGPCTARDGRSRTRPHVRKKVFSLVTFFAPAKKVTRDIQSRKLLLQSLKIKRWIPADGMPSKKAQTLALPSNRPGNDRIRLSSAAGSLLSVDVG